MLSQFCLPLNVAAIQPLNFAVVYSFNVQHVSSLSIGFFVTRAVPMYLST